jgi:hypothetical protein
MVSVVQLDAPRNGGEAVYHLCMAEMKLVILKLKSMVITCWMAGNI